MFLKNSKDLSEWLAVHFDNLTLSSGQFGQERVRAGGACIGLSLQTHQAILLLMETHLVGPAAALVRVMTESYIRGAWLLYCATDREVTKYVKGKKVNEHFSDLINALEAHPDFLESGLSRILGKPWTTMNSYTHCGAHQISRGNTVEGIEPSYSKDECKEFLRLSDGLAIAAASIFAELADRQDLLQELFEKAKALNNESEPH